METLHTIAAILLFLIIAGVALKVQIKQAKKAIKKNEPDSK